MKKSFTSVMAFILMIVMLIPLVASCGTTPSETTPATTTGPVSTTTGQSSGTITPPSVDGYKTDINAVVLNTIAPDALASYKIVYPETAADEIVALANSLAAAIQEKTGVSLPVVSDYVAIGVAVPTDGAEIRVGITNRNRADSWMRAYDYSIVQSGAAINIAATGVTALENAVAEFTSLMLSAEGAKAPTTPYLFQALYAVETLTLGGYDIAHFAIVRDQENSMVATYLQTKIAELTGILLPIRTDKMPAVDYEILIGNIARDGVEYPEAGTYLVKQVGTKLVLGGVGGYAGYNAAMDFITAQLVADTSKTGETLALTVAEKTAAHRTGGLYSLNLPETFGSMAGLYDIEYSAQTVLDRFFATKAELPEEVTVLDRFEVADYPFSQTLQIFVSPDGDDTNPGTEEEPLATFAVALSKVMNRNGGIIWVKGGQYSLESPVSIAAGHSGRATSPLFIKAYGDEKVTLTSTRPFDMERDNWHFLDPSDNADVWERIPEEARENIVYTTLADQGMVPSDIPAITKSAGPSILYVDGVEYNLAQYPNKTIDNFELMYFTYAYDTGKVTSRDGSNLYWPWVERATKAGKDPATWDVGWEIRVLNQKDNAGDKRGHPEMGEEILTWVNTGDIWYYGSTFEGWEFGYYNLALETEGQYWAHDANGNRWTKNSEGVPYLGTPKSGGYYSLKSIEHNSWGCKVSGNSSAGRNTFYLFNAVEALDAPGEWFYDKETGYLYIYPEDDHAVISDAQVSLSNPTPFNLMNISGASNVIIDGLTFDGSSNVGLNVSTANSVIVQNCTFLNTKSTNMNLQNSTDCAVIYSDFSASYSTMLNIGNNDSVNRLKPANNLVQNCFFHDPMPLKQVGLYWSGFRMVASHNYFNNTNTIGQNSVECIIEYNRFEGGSKDITDGGMIYSGGAFNRGNHYRHNLIHMFNATHNAIYNDGMGSGNYMYYNVVSTLHSKSDHNKPWYSSTGWGNVAYANLTLMRTPAEVVAAGANSSMESDITVFQSAQSGDTYNESALFYYYFGDQYSAGGTAARYKPVDYDGNPQLDYKVGTDGKVSFTSQPTLTQSLAGHWWVGKRTSEITNYLGKGDLATWWEHAPEYINALYGTEMILSLYTATTAGEEDYHPRYFYMPWYLCGRTYTYEADLPEGVSFQIPQYSYLERVDGNVYLRTAPEHVAEPNDDGSYTFTYEEVAAMERARRAPQYSAVTNNVILGGTPIYEEKDGKYHSTGIVNRAAVITDSAAKSGYRGYVATGKQENNFMYFSVDDLLPVVRYDFDYTVPDDVWEFIADAGIDDPSLTLTAEALEELKKVDDIKAGVTYDFRYSDWFDEVYPDFD